jgi:hypothetical protein
MGMTDSAHTPGPWAVFSEYPSEVQTASNQTIASCWHAACEGLDISLIGILPCTLEESAANARLIAAAPDLLAALKSAYYALANIAEGFEYSCLPDDLCGEAACSEGGCIRDKRDAARAAIAKAEGQP